MSDHPLPLSEHLRELRNRFVVYLLFLVPVSVYLFTQARRLVDVLLLPTHGRLIHLIVMSPGEALYTFIEIALAAGFVVTLPVLLYQVAAFVSPALSPPERRRLIGYVPIVLLLFLMGIAFGYFAFLPVVLRFLLGFATAPFVPLISLGKYIGFVVNLTLPFGLVFEMPVAVYALARTGVLTPSFLRKQRRVAILAIFIIAGAVTPPDAFSMLLMVAPMLVLYEVSILVADFAVRRRGPMV
ncbi:MAG: twin-arginine translocase subunit TatC [Thermaerobacter sp.]|nr:twin-arginine translocase subunit TatC [Thermaerobacter sp.]